MRTLYFMNTMLECIPPILLLLSLGTYKLSMKAVHTCVTYIVRCSLHNHYSIVKCAHCLQIVGIHDDIHS